jgi:hypothetical protein
MIVCYAATPEPTSRNLFSYEHKAICYNKLLPNLLLLLSGKNLVGMVENIRN